MCLLCIYRSHERLPAARSLGQAQLHELGSSTSACQNHFNSRMSRQDAHLQLAVTQALFASPGAANAAVA